jgi:hypothetical protein
VPIHAGAAVALGIVGVDEQQPAEADGGVELGERPVELACGRQAVARGEDVTGVEADADPRRGRGRGERTVHDREDRPDLAKRVTQA